MNSTELADISPTPDIEDEEDPCGCGEDECPLCNNSCWQCGGEGWGMVGEDWASDDPINGPYDGEIERCPNCRGSGLAKDCWYW